MATSPNYGWLEPDNTDLVKNGALAIRTLGNAIDTTMATMTPKSTVTAKGDIVAATAASTPAALAVGANGTTLVADSTATSGLRWTSTPAASNPVLNSAYNVWQRGTSFTVSSSTLTYTSDRWQAYRGATGLTVTRQTTNDSTNLPFIQYCSRIARDSGNTSTVTSYLVQSFESVNSIPFAGKTITISYYARAGANYSPTSSILTATLQTGTGTDQNWLSYTGAQYPITANATLTTTWQRFTASATLASTATELAILFSNQPTGTAGANDYFEVTGVQIDVGNVALPYRSYAATIQQELAACQRYYYRNSPAAVTTIAIGGGFGTTAVVANLRLPVTMRTRPTALEQSGTSTDYGITDGGGSSYTCNAVPSFVSASNNEATVNFPFTAVISGGAAVQTRFVTTSAYLGWSAEL